MDSAYLEGLNPQQLEAVNTLEGPLLVLAGAGTGKTKVLTTRIAHILCSRRAFPSQILAVTFTNKAAREMKDRVEKLMGEPMDSLWLGTFHSIAAKILRRHAEKVGLKSDYTIIDFDDQMRLMKQILKDRDIDEKKASPRLALYLISRLKDKAIKSTAVPNSEDNNFGYVSLRDLYAEYQRRLKALNACDFGDLLLYNIELLQNHADVFDEYSKRFKYILVDEYQDTNVCQYMWLRLLAKGHNNICCVGDDDQSIYGWRGAEVTNILRFDKDFTNAKVIRLERNYRSTQYILDAATAVISNNMDRHGKQLWTDLKDGNLIKLSSFHDDREEARTIAEEIEDLGRLRKCKLADIAILVRAGYQTRPFEEQLNFLRIPYRIIGGLKFYERAEIKDVIGYIRCLVNYTDSLAFERIINLPRRGIGATTMQQMHLLSRDSGKGLYETAQMMIQNSQIKGKAGASLNALFDQFDYWRTQLSTRPHVDVVKQMLDESGYIQMWKSEGTDESKDRLDNINELLRTLGDYESLPSFLEHISLVTDVDSMMDENKVSVMTMHAAKGLEFDTVFLPGWEEGIFPSQKSLDESGLAAAEEERRLAYVGITRAKHSLYISYANNRRIYGSYQPSIPSRFIGELPENAFEILHNQGSYYRNMKTYRKW